MPALGGDQASMAALVCPLSRPLLPFGERSLSALSKFELTHYRPAEPPQLRGRNRARCRCGAGDIPMHISLSMRVGRGAPRRRSSFPSDSRLLSPTWPRRSRVRLLGAGHFPVFAARGFNRFGFTRFRVDRLAPCFHRFGFNRFDHFGFSRFGWNGWRLGVELAGRHGLGWGYWGDPTRLRRRHLSRSSSAAASASRD